MDNFVMQLPYYGIAWLCFRISNLRHDDPATSRVYFMYWLARKVKFTPHINDMLDKKILWSDLMSLYGYDYQNVTHDGDHVLRLNIPAQFTVSNGDGKEVACMTHTDNDMIPVIERLGRETSAMFNRLYVYLEETIHDKAEWDHLHIYHTLSEAVVILRYRSIIKNLEHIIVDERSVWELLSQGQPLRRDDAAGASLPVIQMVSH